MLWRVKLGCLLRHLFTPRRRKIPPPFCNTIAIFPPVRALFCNFSSKQPFSRKSAVKLNYGTAAFLQSLIILSILTSPIHSPRWKQTLHLTFTRCGPFCYWFTHMGSCIFCVGQFRPFYPNTCVSQNGVSFQFYLMHPSDLILKGTFWPIRSLACNSDSTDHSRLEESCAICVWSLKHLQFLLHKPSRVASRPNFTLRLE